MRIAIGNDHGGPVEAQALADHLRAAGHEVEHVGTYSEESVDYPDYAVLVGQAVHDGRADIGVLICKTGIGMSMTANKIPGIRAAVIHDAFTAEMARRHNDANIACLGTGVVDTDAMLAAVDCFVATAFDGGRHERRVGKINALD